MQRLPTQIRKTIQLTLEIENDKKPHIKHKNTKSSMQKTVRMDRQKDRQTEKKDKCSLNGVLLGSILSLVSAESIVRKSSHIKLYGHLK